MNRRKNSKGKFEFDELSQIYLNLTHETANVMFVNKAIKDAWGDEYKLVTCDGIEIEDSLTTRG